MSVLYICITFFTEYLNLNNTIINILYMTVYYNGNVPPGILGSSNSIYKTIRFKQYYVHNQSTETGKNDSDQLNYVKRTRRDYCDANQHVTL